VYRDPWQSPSNPVERRRAYTIALWFGVAACAFFTAYVAYISYRMFAINDYLVTHPTQTAHATVTKVFSRDHRLTKHPWCAIVFEASFTDPMSRRRFSLTGPDHYGFVGTHIEWSDCDDLIGPIDYGRKLSVGDDVPVVYAVANPSVNRPGWIDYGVRIHTGTVACSIALGMTFLLYGRGPGHVPALLGAGRSWIRHKLA
jgi:hypothetical protein